MMRPYGRCWDIGDTPEYFFKNNVYEDFDTTLIESILGRLLSNAQYNDISELITAVKEAEVTDERRETLSIVNGCLACATSVLDKVSLVGGVDSENPLSHVNILSFLNLYEQCMFVEALDWKNPPSTNAPVSETAGNEMDLETPLIPMQPNCSLAFLLTDLSDFKLEEEPTILHQRPNFFEQRMFAMRHSGVSLLTKEPTTETAFNENDSVSTLTTIQSNGSLQSLSTDLGDVFDDEPSPENHVAVASEEMEITSTIPRNTRDDSEDEPTILGKRKYSGP